MGTMVSMGPVDKGMVVDNLLAKVDAAQVAFDRKQPSVAVQLLQTFIQEVEAQKGRQIRAERASMLTNQAQTVIRAIISTKRLDPAFLKAGISGPHTEASAQQPGNSPIRQLAAAIEPKIKF
jgi:hypothetical protein